MYEYIKGNVAELSPAFAVIEAAGVGYYLNISLNTYTAIETKTAALLYVHFIVREDAQILYGFATREERELFRLLLGVSGVGGNTARTILSTFSPEELTNLISTENAAVLKSVKGLGLKTAQKIIVDLKGKVSAASYVGISGGTSSADNTFTEALSALTMLGFPKNASEKELRAIIKNDPTMTVEELVRAALKRL